MKTLPQTGVGPEHWVSTSGGEWRFVTGKLLPVELARAASLMAARFGPNAKPVRGWRR